MSGVRVRRFWIGIVVAMLLATLVPGPMALAAAGGTSSTLGATARAATTRSWIVTLKPGRNPATRARTLSRSAGGRSGRTFSHALNGFVFRGTVGAAAALRRDPAVRSVVAEPARPHRRRRDPDGRRPDPGEPPDRRERRQPRVHRGRRQGRDPGHRDRPDPSRPRPEPRHRARPQLHDGRSAAGRPRPRHPCRRHRRGCRERAGRRRRRAPGDARAVQGARRHRAPASGPT